MKRICRRRKLPAFFIIDRDWNAAINIREEGKRIFLNYFKTLIEEKQAAAWLPIYRTQPVEHRGLACATLIRWAYAHLHQTSNVVLRWQEKRWSLITPRLRRSRYQTLLTRSPNFGASKWRVVHYQKIEKWNGKLSKVTGGNAIVSLDDNIGTANNETYSIDKK